MLSSGLVSFGLAGVAVATVNIDNPFVAIGNIIGAGLLCCSAWINTAIKLSEGEDADLK